jgi:hypothetical protein
MVRALRERATVSAHDAPSLQLPIVHAVENCEVPHTFDTVRTEQGMAA